MITSIKQAVPILESSISQTFTIIDTFKKLGMDYSSFINEYINEAKSISLNSR